MNIGDKVLITTDGWFFAPDGEQYRAVHGTVKAILNDEEALGIKTNRASTNWFVEIGNALIAGCQIHYAVKSETFNPEPPSAEIDHEGARHVDKCGTSRIYNADQ